MIDIKICTLRGTKTVCVVICGDGESETYRYSRDKDVQECVSDALDSWLHAPREET